MATIDENLQAVLQRVARAARAAGRDPASIRVLAVSKTHAAPALAQACGAGQRAFGENYVQEAIDKMEALGALVGTAMMRELEWHLIGPLQSNKTRVVAERFAWVHAIDREKIAQRLSAQRAPDRPALNVLMQVNISGESTKSGVAPNEIPRLARAIAPLPRLRLRGLMAIPEASPDAALQRSRFRAVRELLAQLRADGLDVDTLSMGMSDDLEAAIAEGSTMVRVGTAIFGQRAVVHDAGPAPQSLRS